MRDDIAVGLAVLISPSAGHDRGAAIESHFDVITFYSQIGFAVLYEVTPFKTLQDSTPNVYLGVVFGGQPI